MITGFFVALYLAVLNFAASFNESFLLLTLRKRIDPVRGYRTSIHGDIEQQYMVLVFL